MKTAEEIAQWVISNRYPLSENEKVSDFEMYNKLVEDIKRLCLSQNDDDDYICPCNNVVEHYTALGDKFYTCGDCGEIVIVNQD